MRIFPEAKQLTHDLQTRFYAENKDESRIPARTWYIIGIIGIAILSLSFTLLLFMFGLTTAILLVAIVIAFPAVLIIIAYPETGIILLLISAYFIMWVLRMGVNFPLGTLMDGIQALLIFTFFLNQKYHPNWKIFSTPIAFIILIWVAYTFLQVANPFAESRLAWVYTVRSVAVVSLLYFIFSYFIKSISIVRIILYLWMVLSFLAAVNAFKQEYFDFFEFEKAGFNDPLVQSLLFINGTWRKFSIFSDPVAFSYNMAVSTLFCISIIASPNTIRKKLIFAALGGFFTMAMLFSATRASYVLLPASILFYVVLNINRRVLAFGVVAACFMFVIINIPTSNATLYRFQSAFKPSEDASFNVRKMNQKKIQPYIQSHPIGGGLGATGVWGAKFAPYSFLAQLPPDSGYVRVAAEMGWIGLLIFCTMFFIIIRQGILNYYAIRDPELKSYCLAMTLIVFALNVGSYPQEALVQFPTSIYFYLYAALINITLELDKEKQAKKAIAL